MGYYSIVVWDCSISTKNKKAIHRPMFKYHSLIPWGSFWGWQEEKWGSFRGQDHFGVDLGIISGSGSFRGLYSMSHVWGGLGAHARLSSKAERNTPPWSWLVRSCLSVSEGSGSQLEETVEARDDGKEERKGERRRLSSFHLPITTHSRASLFLLSPAHIPYKIINETMRQW